MVGLVILLSALAIGIVSLVVLDILNKGLFEYEKRYLEKSSGALTQMFIFIDGRQILLMTILTSVVLLCAGLLLFSWYFALLIGAIGFLLPFFAIKKLRARRIRRFDQQLVTALMQMSAGMRAGLSLIQTTQNAAEEMPEPLSQEFGLFLKEIKLGVQVDAAFANMTKRIESENLLLVVTATNIARQLGGNIAEIFESISKTISDRFRLEARVSALTSMGKMQGWVVGLMPVVMGVVFNYMRPDLVGPMLEHPFGAALVFAIILMEGLGILMIRKIIAIDV